MSSGSQKSTSYAHHVCQFFFVPQMHLLLVTSSFPRALQCTRMTSFYRGHFGWVFMCQLMDRIIKAQWLGSFVSPSLTLCSCGAAEPPLYRMPLVEDGTGWKKKATDIKEHYDFKEVLGTWVTRFMSFVCLSLCHTMLEFYLWQFRKKLTRSHFQFSKERKKGLSLNTSINTT